MRVMVTGGGGFLGRWIVRELEARGHETSAPRSRGPGGYDLRNIWWIDAALRELRPDAVVHAAAAVGGIGANVAEPGRFYFDNTVMGAQLLERCRLFGIQKVVVIGTACEYPEHCPQPMRESDVWDGYPAPATSAYGIAKRGLLAQGQAYREQYGFDVVHVIPGNLYGPGDHFEGDGIHVVPAMIRRFSDAVLDDHPVKLWGTGRPTRDFLFASDAAVGIADVLERYSNWAPLNLASGVETPIKSLAEKIAAYYGSTARVWWDASRPDGAPRHLLDITRARTELGWKPTIGLDEGLSRTIEFYEAAVREGVL